MQTIILPLDGGQDPYTLASPDFPFAKWRHSMFFIKLSESITTGDESKLASAVEILDYTYPAITLLFPKIQEKDTYPPFTMHIAGLGVPMLTSPTDDPTIYYIEESEKKTASQSTATLEAPNKWAIYTKITIFTLLGMSTILAIYLLLDPIKSGLRKAKTGLSVINKKIRRQISVENMEGTIKKIIGKTRTFAGKSVEKLSYIFEKLKVKQFSISLMRRTEHENKINNKDQALNSTTHTSTETQAVSRTQGNSRSRPEDKDKENISEIGEDTVIPDPTIMSEQSINTPSNGKISQPSETNNTNSSGDN